MVRRGIVAGFVLAIVVAAIVGYLCVRSGAIPANADARPGALENWAARTSLNATLDREAPKSGNPIPDTEQNLLVGVRLFARNCAVCHGSAKGDAAIAHCQGALPKTTAICD